MYFGPKLCAMWVYDANYRRVSVTFIVFNPFTSTILSFLECKDTVQANEV